MAKTDEIINYIEKLGFDNPDEREEIFNYALENPEIFNYIKEDNFIDLLNEISKHNKSIEADEKNNNNDEDEEEIIMEDFPSNDRSMYLASSSIKGKYIQEYENDNIYIPDSSYCGVKVLNKYFEMQGRGINIIPYKGVCAYKITKNNLIKHMLKYMIKCDCENVNGYKCCSTKCIKEKNKNFKDNKINNNKWFNENVLYKSKDDNIENTAIPDFCKIEICHHLKTVKIKNITKRKINNPNFVVGIIKLKDYKCIHHAILIKNIKNISIDDFQLSRSSKYKLNPESYGMNKYIIRNHNSICCAYDIETYVVSNIEEKKLTLYPAAIGFKIFNIDTGNTITEYETIHDVFSLESETNIYSLYKIFFEKLERYCSYIRVKKINVYAHNGGKFDNIFAADIPGLKYKSVIYDGNHVKKLVVIKGDVTIVLLDSLPFTLSSLENSCKTFKTEIHKQKFDIINKPKSWYSFHYNDESYDKLKDNKNFIKYINNDFDNINKICKVKNDNDNTRKDWMTYLKYDVESLTDLLLKVQKMYKDFGFSITNYVGLSGVAWDIMHSYCYGLKYCTIPKDPTIIQFYRESYYGGRTIFFKNNWESKLISNNNGILTYDDYLICIDMNSLYPSVMYSMPYPTGEPILIDPEKDKWLDKKHYIVNVEVEIPNIRYAIHPVRKNGMLVYPSNQTITGTYNDVDLREMLKDGYKIKKFNYGVYFRGSIKIFNQLINMLYEKRKYYKNLPNDNHEQNKEYICKIIMNSCYGKYNETIHSTNNFYNTEKFLIKLRKMLKNENNLHDYKNIPNDKIFEHAKKYLKNIKFKKLDNSDTYLVYKRLDNPTVKKPTYIASYITSYSRALVNEIIREVKVENVYASDTDSLYIPMSRFKECNLNTGNELCGFKNDYGENTMITKAIFLDIKRAYIELSQNTKYNSITNETYDTIRTIKTFKFKFTGVNFKDITKVCNVLSPENRETGLSVYNSEEEYYNIMNNCKNIAETLLKNKSNNEKENIRFVMNSFNKTKVGVEISNKEMQFVVSPEKRGQWINNEYSALGFSFDKEEFTFTHNGFITELEDSFKNRKNVIYGISTTKYLKSNRPIFYLSRFKYRYISTKDKDYYAESDDIYNNRRNVDAKVNDYSYRIREVNDLVRSNLIRDKNCTQYIYNHITYLSNSCVVFDDTKTWKTDYYVKFTDDCEIYRKDNIGYIHDMDKKNVEIYYMSEGRYYIPNIINVKHEVKNISNNLYPVFMLSDEFNFEFGVNNLSFYETFILYNIINNFSK